MLLKTVALIAHVAASGSAVAAQHLSAPPDRRMITAERRDAIDPAKVKAAAEEHLAFLYTMYFAIRGCTEASTLLAKDEYRPTVSLDQARATMKEVDAAAKEVGIDIEAVWSKASPIGETTAQSLKVDTPTNLDRCRQSGRYFRLVLSRLQVALSELGSSRNLIPRDY